jgi:hypothetical protein
MRQWGEVVIVVLNDVRACGDRSHLAIASGI